VSNNVNARNKSNGCLPKSVQSLLNALANVSSTKSGDRIHKVVDSYFVYENRSNRIGNRIACVENKVTVFCLSIGNSTYASVKINSLASAINRFSDSKYGL
jgi:hypothetical protein